MINTFWLDIETDGADWGQDLTYNRQFITDIINGAKVILTLYSRTQNFTPNLSLKRSSKLHLGDFQ